MTPELLAEILNYLDITWQDDGAVTKITGIAERAMKSLNRIAGYELDFTENDHPKELLFDYIRYAYSDALDEFAVNYQHELIRLQIDKAVENATQPET